MDLTPTDPMSLVPGLLIAGVLGLAWVALVIWSIVSVLRSGESQATIAGWIAGIVLVPFFGSLAWLLRHDPTRRAERHADVHKHYQRPLL